jgi:hypothetical protein
MSPGCCRDKRPPFPRRMPFLSLSVDGGRWNRLHWILGSGHCPRLGELRTAPRPGVDGRCPFMPRLRLEGPRRPNPPAPPWFFSRSTVEGLGCCRPTGYPATRSATASARAPSTRSFGTYAHGYPYSAYFVGGEQSEIPIRIGKFCGNVVWGCTSSDASHLFISSY